MVLGLKAFVAPVLIPCQGQRHAWRISAVPLPEVAEWDGFGAERVPEFLADFWQKRPLFIRGAFRPEDAVLGPSELLGLACDDQVASRMVEREADGQWSLLHGPFDESDFVPRPGDTRRWTVLVSEVDRHVPEVSDLLSRFTFLPNWRLDDIQISYAPKGGGIGGHVDNYDVFLLQGPGRRRWAIENRLLTKEEELERLVKESPVRVFTDFNEDRAWEMEPGDMLYLPPRVPHNGLSLTNQACTYSIGLRAPSQRELLQALVQAAQGLLEGEGAFYADPDLRVQEDCGELTRASLERARGLVKAAVDAVLEDPLQLARCMGAHLTAPRRPRLGGEAYPQPQWESDAGSEWTSARDVVEALGRGEALSLYRAEGVKFAFTRDKGGLLLFVDGNVWAIEGPGAEEACRMITKSLRLEGSELAGVLEGACQQVRGAVEELIGRGYMYPVRDEDE